MAASVPEGPLALVSVHSDHVLEVADGAGAGAVAVQSADQGAERQRWRMVLTAEDELEGTFYKVVNLHSGLALEIEHASPENGAAVLQGEGPEEHDAWHTQWQPIRVPGETENSYYIVNRGSKKVFDVEGGATEQSRKEGTRIVQWNYWAGPNQQWRLVPASLGEPLSHSALPCLTRPALDTAQALSLMRDIFGWFSEQEAELLLRTASRVLTELPEDHALIEVGSYLGRSTVLLASAVRDLRPKGRVVAIDPHGGTVSTGNGLEHGTPTYDAFCANITAAGLQDVVHAIRRCSTDISWKRPIGLLFVDGLHDYDNVRADFSHFEPWIVPGGFVAFHDYSTEWPGVMRLVDEMTERGSDYLWADRVDSLVVLRKNQMRKNQNR